MKNLLLLAVGFILSWAAGAKDLLLLEDPDRWVRVGGGESSFSFYEGELEIERHENDPSALLTRDDYENYEVEFECRMSRWCVSGLFLNVPRNGAYRAGLEIELNNHNTQSPDLTSPGALFRKIPPKATTMNPHGEWNRVRARLDWPRLTVEINGETVQYLDLAENDETRATLRRGAIGFQNLGLPIQVRDFVVRPLPDKEHGLVLFNGKDFEGWEILDKGPAKWLARDGAIVGKDGNGYLRHEWIGQDFDLRMMIRTTPVGNGGVFFRWLPNDLNDRGHEIQILDVPGARVPTGSVYHYARGNDLALTPGEWELLQIYARGPRVWTYLNGIKCAETDRVATVRKGHIVLQMHKGDSEIEFKDLVLVGRDEG